MLLTNDINVYNVTTGQRIKFEMYVYINLHVLKIIAPAIQQHWKSLPIDNTFKTYGVAEIIENRKI